MSLLTTRWCRKIYGRLNKMCDIYTNTLGMQEEEEYSDGGWSDSEWDEENIYEDVKPREQPGDYLEPVSVTALPTRDLEVPQARPLGVPQARPLSAIPLLKKVKQRFSTTKNRLIRVPSMMKAKKELRSGATTPKKRPEIIHLTLNPEPLLVPMSPISPAPGCVRTKRVCRCANGCRCPHSMIIFPPKEKQQ